MRFDAGETFLEIDLLKKSDSRKSGFKLSGIATQGDSKLQAWVSQFQEGPKILNILNGWNMILGKKLSLTGYSN